MSSQRKLTDPLDNSQLPPGPQYRMPVGVEHAATFIAPHGSAFERSRLDMLLGEGFLLSPEQERRFLDG